MIDESWARGIDISYANGITPNLKGRSFVFVRACYGTAHDTLWAYHSINVRQAGKILGAYAFGVYGDGATQARAFLAIAGDADLYALDLEKESGKPRMTAVQAMAFIATVQASGRDIGLYHSVSGFPNLNQDWNWPAGGPGWDNQMGGSRTPPNMQWSFWQYRGYPLDLDYYHGDEAALAIFASTGGNEMIRSRGAVAMKDGAAVLLKRIRITTDTPLLESPGGRKIATAKVGYRYPYVGVGAGSTRAVFVDTPKPYADGISGPAVLYVAASAVVIEDYPVPPSGGDITHTVTISIDGVESETFAV